MESLGIKWIDASAGLTFAKVIKKIDQVKNSDTTLADDDELVIALATGKTYFFFMMVVFQTTSTPDFKYAFSLPTNSAQGVSFAGDWDSIVEIQEIDMTTSESITVTSSGVLYLEIRGRITTTAAGNLGFQWAQNTSDAADTKVLAGASLIVWEQNA